MRKSMFKLVLSAMVAFGSVYAGTSVGFARQTGGCGGPAAACVPHPSGR